jgi:hypothetical protein
MWKGLSSCGGRAGLGAAAERHGLVRTDEQAAAGERPRVRLLPARLDDQFQAQEGGKISDRKR